MHKKFIYTHSSVFDEGDKMGAKSVTLARQKRKRELVEIMGSKCVLCGYDKCIAAFVKVRKEIVGL